MSEQITGAGPPTHTTTVQTTMSDLGGAVIALRGEIDAANTPDLHAELERHLSDGRRLIHIDAAAITFIDSAAIGELIISTEKCRRAQGSLILTNVPSRVQRVISMTGLDDILHIDNGEDATSAEHPSG
jgi:anti-sigma B factor antagonist